MNVDRKRKLLAPLSYLENENTKRLIVVLDGCPLESGKVGNEYKLLNCDDHRNFLSRVGKNPDDYRPDIVHQSLLALFDSPLNKAGLLEVFIHTKNNVLIKINQHCRIPRTYKRFAGLMVQLLHKFKISTADDSNAVLMKIIKNPITDHLPKSAFKVATSWKAEKLMRLEEYVPTIFEAHAKLNEKEEPASKKKKTEEKKEEPSSDIPVVFVVGGFSHGQIDAEYCHEQLSISQYPLSAALVCMKICNAFEEHWNIL